MINIRPFPIEYELQRENTPFVVPKNRALPPIVPVKYDGYRIIGPNQYQVPVTLEIPSSRKKFTFPTDPLVSVSTKNIVVRRQVLKASNTRGTIKERWSMDDFSVSIAGVLNSDENHCSADYVMALLEIAQATESVKITCPYINDTYDILRIAIENVDFPFTQGIDAQKFSIKAFSDEEYKLLIEN